jgi:hypothetical protein
MGSWSFRFVREHWREPDLKRIQNVSGFFILNVYNDITYYFIQDLLALGT